MTEFESYCTALVDAANERMKMTGPAFCAYITELHIMTRCMMKHKKKQRLTIDVTFSFNESFKVTFNTNKS